MIVEYSVNLENRTKQELISMIEDAQEIIAKQQKEIEELKVQNKNIINLDRNIINLNNIKYIRCMRCNNLIYNGKLVTNLLIKTKNIN